MNTTQLTALCQRHQGILLDADNEVVHAYATENAPGSGHEKQRQRSRFAESDVSIRSGATGF